MEHSPLPDEAIHRLQETVRGKILLPGHDDYDDSRQVWNAMIDHRPDLIVRPLDTQDVLEAVRIAGTYDFPLSVKGGGHHVSGTAVPDYGMLLDLAEMNHVAVDPTAQIARVQAGATWGDVDAATQAHGLAVPGGQDPNIGVAGLTLGGGVGWLSRKYGLTCDNVRSVELVTEKGELIRASTDEYSDLFWGLCGGGGRFGVVTSFEYDLHRVGPEIFAGSIAYPLTAAPEVLRNYRAFMVDAPLEVRVLFGIMALPPVTHVPEHQHGQRAVMLIVCYAGPPDTGREVLAPLRSVGTPFGDSIKQRTYTAFQRAGESRGSVRTYLRSQYLTDLTDEAIEIIHTHGSDSPSTGATIFVSPRSGAETALSSDATAYPHRTPAHHVLIEARWEDPAADGAHIDWVQDGYQALMPHTTGEVSMNFLTEDESVSRRRAAYGENYQRLQALQRKWDPGGRFRNTCKIDPTDTG